MGTVRFKGTHMINVSSKKMALSLKEETVLQVIHSGALEELTYQALTNQIKWAEFEERAHDLVASAQFDRAQRMNHGYPERGAE